MNAASYSHLFFSQGKSYTPALALRTWDSTFPLNNARAKQIVGGGKGIPSKRGGSSPKIGAEPPRAKSLIYDVVLT